MFNNTIRIPSTNGVLTPLDGLLTGPNFNRNPRNLKFVIPSGHTISLAQNRATPLGDKIDLDNSGGGPSLIIDIPLWTADEANVSPHLEWTNLFVSVPLNQFFFIIVSY